MGESFAQTAHPRRSFDAVLSDEQHRAVVAIVEAHAAHDVSQYKHAAIARRVAERVTLLGLESVDVYLRYLAQTSTESQLLFDQLLVSVSSFFRDPDAFDVFGSIAREELGLRGHPMAVRAWTAGCATGEEAYSIAILLHELLQSSPGSQSTWRVFATDIDPHALQRARAGRYSAAIAEDVGEERLARFFEREAEHLVVQSALRRTLVFAEHDLVTCPPLPRLDLVSCRNVLIYFEPAFQQKLFRIFHRSLNPGGLLFVGPAESADEDLFVPLDARARVYRRRPTTATSRPIVSTRIRYGSATYTARDVEPAPTAGKDARELIEMLAAANDELRAKNEELISAMTDLQAMNRELRSADRAARASLDELARTNDDLANVVNAGEVAALILDVALEVVRVTEPARALLAPGCIDPGRLLENAAPDLRSSALLASARGVLATRVPEVVEVTTADGRQLVARVTPYRTSENVVAGIILHLASPAPEPPTSGEPT